MNARNKIIGIAMSGMIGLGMVSCIDGNDWGVDSSYARLFAVNSGDISVSAEDIQASVSFAGISGTEYYVIEVSTDSLYDDIAMGGPNAIVFGQNKEITSSPALLTGLMGDTRYFLRIKSMSDTVKESIWSYYNDGKSFKTLAEQIFNSATDADRFEDHINLSWTPGAEVTHILVSATGMDDVTRNLSADEIAAGACTVSNLNASTAYTFVIYNGETKRGTLNISTTAAMPSGDYKYELPAGVTVIDQILMDELYANAQAVTGSSVASVTIGIPAGTTIDYVGVDPETGENAAVTLAEGFSVTFFGLSGGEKPVLNFVKSLDISGSHAYIRFENVAIADGGCQYLINQANDSNLGELSFKQCTAANFERSIIRTQGSGTINIDNILVDDCVFTNLSSGDGYSVFYFGTATTNVGKLDISNCTFNTTKRSFIEASKAPVTNGIFITNCTFYNNVTSGRYFMDANGQETNLTMTNTILGMSMVDTARGARTKGTITFENCLRASDCLYSANDIKLDADSRSSADIFADPANGDFTLKINERLGDPRWYPTEN